LTPATRRRPGKIGRARGSTLAHGHGGLDYAGPENSLALETFWDCGFGIIPGLCIEL
jgi:hypothetical protein